MPPGAVGGEFPSVLQKRHPRQNSSELNFAPTQPRFRMLELLIVAVVDIENPVPVARIELRRLTRIRFASMISVLVSMILSIRSWFQSRVELQLELLALRHQLDVLNRSRPRRLRPVTADRWLWTWLSRAWPAWRTALVIVKPETVIAWHRQGFRLFWTWKSRPRLGRPPVPTDVRELIRTMSEGNPLWGTAHARRAVETGHRGVSGQRGEVHGPALPTAVTNVADPS